MTESEFTALQEELKESNTTVQDFLKSKGVSKRVYYHWRKKMQSHHEAGMQIVPISVSEKVPPAHCAGHSSGITVSFPNGVLAHFSPEMQPAALEFLLSQSR